MDQFWFRKKMPREKKAGNLKLLHPIITPDQNFTFRIISRLPQFFGIFLPFSPKPRTHKKLSLTMSGKDLIDNSPLTAHPLSVTSRPQQQAP